MKNLKYFGKGLKKLTPFVLAGTIMATMVACGKEEKDNVLDGTILENTVVATTDDGNVYLVEETINNNKAFVFKEALNNAKDIFLFNSGVRLIEANALYKRNTNLINLFYTEYEYFISTKWYILRYQIENS